MRVLFTSHGGELWGAERSLLELIEELRRLGIEPAVACPDKSLLADTAAQSGIPVLPLSLRPLTRTEGTLSLLRGSGRLLGTTARLARSIRELRIDLVHANTTVAQLWTGPAALMARVPCVWHWRDFYDFPRINRTLARTASASIVVSEAVQRFARSQLGNNGRLFLVPNGVADRWAPARLRRGSVPVGSIGLPSSSWRSRWDISETDVVVVLPGQAIPRKGHEVLVRAIAAALPREPRLRAVLAHPGGPTGLPAQFEPFRSLASELRCLDRITFAVPSDDIVPLLEESDILAVPSWREPFGRIAVEGMLAARPVVASDVDGLSSIVVDEETGFLVPPGDHGRLADALVALASRPDLRERLGRAGRDRALARFPITEAAQGVLRVYRSVARARA